MTPYAEINAFNWSSLKEMANSPLHYQWRQSHPREDTDSLLLGRAVHCLILEPDRFDHRYLVRPEGLDGRTKEGKAWLSDARSSGLEILTADQGEIARICATEVGNHPVCADLLRGTRREEVMAWTDPDTRIGCKGRIDAIAPDRLIDVKTVRDLGRIERDSYDLLYHAQLAWYLEGAVVSGLLTDDADVYVIPVETTPPYDCGVLRVPPYVLEEGDRVWKRLLGLWIACRDAGIWPGRYPSIGTLDLPRWAQNRIEDGW